MLEIGLGVLVIGAIVYIGLRKKNKSGGTSGSGSTGGSTGYTKRK